MVEKNNLSALPAVVNGRGFFLKFDREELTQAEYKETVSRSHSFPNKTEDAKNVQRKALKPKVLANVDARNGKEVTVHKEEKKPLLLSENRKNSQEAFHLQGLEEETSRRANPLDDVPLPSKVEVRHEVTRGESHTPKPATDASRSQLTYWGFEQGSDSREGNSNFRQESTHQNFQKHLPVHTFSIDLRNFSLKAGFTRNALNLSINFLSEQGVTPSLIEEIESVIRSSGIALGRIQLKVKGKTVYSSNVKKEEVSLELRV